MFPGAKSYSTLRETIAKTRRKGYNKGMERIRQKLAGLPATPGCYIMHGADGGVIYVGKAVNLKRRVSQYFHKNVKGEKVRSMVQNIADFEYVVTNTEIDALSLEANLIKKYRPKYNILLKDDKQYPYIRVDVKSDFPTFTVSRRVKKDGAKYFGPFMGGVNVKDVLEILNLAFTVRPCTVKISPDKAQKPCLNYHMHKCLAPCAHLCDKETYRVQVDAALDFLSGNDAVVEQLLTQKMLAFAEKEQFEVAIRYKTQLEMLDKIKQKRLTDVSRSLNVDAVAFVSDGIYSVVNLLYTRAGRMQGSRNFELSAFSGDKKEGLEHFLLEFYRGERELPDEILIAEAEDGAVNEEDFSAIESYLRTLYGKAVEIHMPKQGVKKRLTEMAEKNAQEYLEKFIERIQAKDDMTVRAADRLRGLLGLTRYPHRMECYDISHVSGVDKVGSMVVFINGEPAKEEYRRFKIKTVEGSNDFACLKEVLLRRLKKLGTDEEPRFPKPDLIIIDGGKGQLSSVKEIFDGLGVADIDLVSLAKREEEIFLPGQSEPVVISHRDSALKLVQRIRDEAHRFAITYHRNLRDAHELRVLLTRYPGVGKEKAKALLEYFRSTDHVAEATEEELMQVRGIGKVLAHEICAASLAERGESAADKSQEEKFPGAGNVDKAQLSKDIETENTVE